MRKFIDRKMRNRTFVIQWIFSLKFNNHNWDILEEFLFFSIHRSICMAMNFTLMKSLPTNRKWRKVVKLTPERSHACSHPQLAIFWKLNSKILGSM
jgi:hypothetical protein